MKVPYRKHKCGSLVPLLLLIVINIMAFEQIIGVFTFVNASKREEVLVFVFSLILTHYYLYKQHSNIRAYFKWLKNLFKGKK